MRDCFNAFTLNVITRMAFGKKFCRPVGNTAEGGDLDKTWINMIHEVAAKFGTMLAESLHYLYLGWIP
jgi:hypothetical protein